MSPASLIRIRCGCRKAWNPGWRLTAPTIRRHSTFSNATHVCEIVVDIETGAVDIERYIVAEDCGRVLNPAIVTGQQHGAVALGIGGVLQECVVYDENGQNLTGSFLDYAMPVAADMPNIQLISMHTPSRRTLSGTKGMSEGGVMGAVGAVPIAVADALAPFGVVVERQPLTPAAVHELLRLTTRG